MQRSDREVERWIGRELVGVDGRPIGTIDDIYLDTAATAQPEWLAVKTRWPPWVRRSPTPSTRSCSTRSSRSSSATEDRG